MLTTYLLACCTSVVFLLPELLAFPWCLSWFLLFPSLNDGVPQGFALWFPLHLCMLARQIKFFYFKSQMLIEVNIYPEPFTMSLMSLGCLTAFCPLDQECVSRLKIFLYFLLLFCYRILFTLLSKYIQMLPYSFTYCPTSNCHLADKLIK